MYKEILDSISYQVENYSKKPLDISQKLLIEFLNERELLLYLICRKDGFFQSMQTHIMKKSYPFLGDVIKAEKHPLGSGFSYIHGFGNRKFIIFLQFINIFIKNILSFKIKKICCFIQY